MKQFSPGSKRLFLGLILSSSIIFIRAQENSYFPKSTPEAQGISSSAILNFIETAENEVDALHSFMIIRHGILVAEGWWSPYAPELPHIMHSLSKSFTSTAIGFAVDEGLLSLNDRVIDFFPEETPKNPSANLKAMRIRDLITMNTGHINEPFPRAEKTNWVKAFLEAEVPLKPGTHFRYNSLATYMLSAIIQKVSGEKLVDFLTPRLFDPLHINKPEWDECPMGINTAGWGLHITTEDIAKLGQLYLQKGMWEGKRLLSEEWVEMATFRQVSNGSNPDNDWEQGYGFQFWRCRYNNYRGDGAFGQFCIVMPDKDAVVAITSGTNDMGHVMEIVWETLLPAMQEGPLPENPAVYARLTGKLGNLKLKPIAGESTSPMAKKITRSPYLVNENPEGVKTVAFDFGKKATSVRFGKEQGSVTVNAGDNGYITGEASTLLPFAGHIPGAIAASGAWIDPGHYQLRVQFIENTGRVTYDFYFTGKELKMNSMVEHALFTSDKREELKGSQAE